MRKLVIVSFLVTLLATSVIPTQAAGGFTQSSTNFHNNFQSYLSLSQPTANLNGFTSGMLTAQLDLSGVRVQFVPHIYEDANCNVKFEPQWDAFYEVSYDAVISEDPKFEDQKNYFTFSVNLKLDINGNIIWSPQNPNFSFLIQDWRSDFNQDYPLGQYFTQEGNKLRSRGMAFPIEGGKTYYLKETLNALENVVCTNKNYSGGFAISPSVEKVTQIHVQNASQEINASFPTGNVALNQQAVRISYSSTSSLPVEAIEVDSRICIANGSVIILKNVGSCQIRLSQKGGNGYAPVSKIIKFQIASNVKRTIVCVKGSLRKNATGVNPVCPPGYKAS